MLVTIDNKEVRRISTKTIEIANQFNQDAAAEYVTIRRLVKEAK